MLLVYITCVFWRTKFVKKSTNGIVQGNFIQNVAPYNWCDFNHAQKIEIVTGHVKTIVNTCTLYLSTIQKPPTKRHMKRRDLLSPYVYKSTYIVLHTLFISKWRVWNELFGNLQRHDIKYCKYVFVTCFVEPSHN